MESDDSATSTPVEVLFDRNVRGGPRRGRAHLEVPAETHDASRDMVIPGMFGLRKWEVDLLVFVRDLFNGSLANITLIPSSAPCGRFYFDFYDADDESSHSFSGDGHSFIGVSVPMAKKVISLSLRLAKSGAVREFMGLRPGPTDPNSFSFALFWFAFMFLGWHEHAHHLLGHQPGVTPQGDIRTTSLKGNLQSQTREGYADSYAAMHVLDLFIASDLRTQASELLALRAYPSGDHDRILFLGVLAAVAGTWFRRPPDVLDAESVYRSEHPPRAARLAIFMHSATLWSRLPRRPNLVGAIHGQDFANFMALVGLAVCDDPRDADSSAQNAFMRSVAGQEYARLLITNIDAHGRLIGDYGV
jgi:hypothetical protein